MASLEEYNPGRWGAEDEDFLDREDNYVLQKSTNALVTNITAKTRRSRSLAHEQRINGNHPSNNNKSTMSNNNNSSRREPPSFASTKSLRKTPSRRGSSSKRSSSSSKLHQAPSPPSSNHHPPSRPAPPKQPVSARTTPLVSNRKTPTKAVLPSQRAQSLPSNKKPLPGVLGLANDDDKERDSDEESLDIEQVFPVLQEAPKSPPTRNDRLYQSQHIFIPTKQEKWNEASVMRMHQSMFSVHREKESPDMKDIEFDDDDDKSLDITDVFPVLADDKKKSTAIKAKTPSSSGPAILQAAKQANANKRWRTAGQNVAATIKPTPPPPATATPPSSPKVAPPVPVPLTRPAAPPPPVKPPPPPTRQAPPPHPAAAPAAAKKPPTSPSKVAALVNQFEHRAHESQDTAASTNDGKRNKGYQLPTHVTRPTASTEDILGASDDLTMDSALLKGAGSNPNLKEQEERIAAQEREEEARRSIEERQRKRQEDEEQQMRNSASRPEGTSDRLDRKRSKRSKKSSKSKKKKKKKSSSRRQLEDYAQVDRRERREQDTSLGPETMMAQEDAERAQEEAERERRRLKKERKERKKQKKKMKHAQSAREFSSHHREKDEDVQMSKSMPDIEESQSSSPDSAAPLKSMSESQPAVASKPALDSYLKERERRSEPRGSTRRSLQSAASSRKSSESKRTSKSDGHVMRAKSLRQRRGDDDDADADDRLDSYISEHKKKAAVSSSKISVRSDSHTTIQRSNVAKKKDPSSYSHRLPTESPREEKPTLDADTFMESAADGMLYESEDSWSPGAAAAKRERIRTAREESRRTASPSADLDYGPSYRKNAAIKPVTPTKENFDKNKASSFARPSNSTGHRGDSPVRRPDLMDNDRMESVGNFDMMSAVDAAVASKKAEKQGSGNLASVQEEEKPKKKKKKGLLKRMFSRHSPKKTKAPERKSRSVPSISTTDVPQSTDQAALNEYLSSSQSSWYSSPALEKEELSPHTSSPANVELPQNGGFKYALGTPPGYKHRSDRLATSLPHLSSRRR